MENDHRAPKKDRYRKFPQKCNEYHTDRNVQLIPAEVKEVDRITCITVRNTNDPVTADLVLFS